MAAIELPTPAVVKTIARQNGYKERRAEASSTLFFQKSDDEEQSHPTLINVFYTTGGVMTKLHHPTKGYNQLWRSHAYDSVVSLEAIFATPRMHTGKGYRTADHSKRGCCECGLQRVRGDFSKNQWRKGPGNAKCTHCIQQQGERPAEEMRIDDNEETKEDTSRIPWESLVDSIVCDAEECGNASPSIRCSSCHMVYYCSKACQRNHQRVHSADCLDLDRLRVAVTDPNLNSGLCNARASTLSDKRQFAMVTRLSGRRTVDVLLLQAECIHQADGHWEQAIGLYKEIVMKSEDPDTVASPPQWRQVWMGLSRCFYELQLYDNAMDAGSAALEMNRHFPQVHRYIALSQKASGDFDKAIDTMKQAVLYEAPWNEETIQFNQDLLRELLSK